MMRAKVKACILQATEWLRRETVRPWSIEGRAARTASFPVRYLTANGLWIAGTITPTAPRSILVGDGRGVLDHLLATVVAVLGDVMTTMDLAAGLIGG